MLFHKLGRLAHNFNLAVTFYVDCTFEDISVKVKGQKRVF